MGKDPKEGKMTQTYQGGTVTAPALTAEKRKETELLLAELVLLSAAITAVRGARLPPEERERRLTPILARRVAVEARLFPEQ